MRIVYKVERQGNIKVEYRIDSDVAQVLSMISLEEYKILDKVTNGKWISPRKIKELMDEGKFSVSPKSREERIKCLVDIGYSKSSATKIVDKLIELDL